MRGAQIADIWSCGVMVYVMLVGAYPFERPEDKHDNQKLQKMIQACAPGLHLSKPPGKLVSWASVHRMASSRCASGEACAITEQPARV